MLLYWWKHNLRRFCFLHLPAIDASISFLSTEIDWSPHEMWIIDVESIPLSAFHTLRNVWHHTVFPKDTTLQGKWQEPLYPCSSFREHGSPDAAVSKRKIPIKRLSDKRFALELERDVGSTHTHIYVTTLSLWMTDRVLNFVIWWG